LDWDELRELAGEGVLNFGAHTRTHPILTQATLSQAHDEISGSLYDLRREIPESLPVFAYPNGNCSPEILEIMHEEGYQLAFTTEDGINNLNTANPLLLRRINITRRTSLKLFRLRLQRWFSAVDVYRHQ
ncbi:MAG: polysaccharide deacetylase family protein, partial [Calditrichaeota bacterium]|nr:polysaccharide deacetylase family protein [Calditrichota bacterium]